MNERPGQFVCPTPEPPRWYQLIKRFLWWRWRRRVGKKFDKVAFPHVRRVYPTLCAKDIVSIQPMDEPHGLDLYFDELYGPKKETK